MTRLRCFIAAATVAVGAFSLMMLGGCQSMTTPTTTTAPPEACTAAQAFEYEYALNGDVVSMYSVDSCTGALTPTTPGAVPTGASSQEIAGEQMVASPAGTFAYVANLGSNAEDDATISMYTINPDTGVLTPTTPATVPTGYFPQGIGISPGGNFVYTANSDDNTVSMFTVNSTTGVLTPTAPPTVATGWSPLSVTVDPTGHFAYVANQVDDTVSMYTVNATTGVLTPTTPPTVPTGDSPFGVTVDPSDKFAYVANPYDGNDGTVSQYTINPSTGVLTPNAAGMVIAGNQPTSVAVDPSGKFAYVTNRMDDTVSMFTINPNGGNLIPNGTVGAGGEPFRMVFDPSGKFAYVANEDSPISIYTLNNNGTLTPMGTAETENGGSLSLAVVPSLEAMPAGRTQQ
jgi:6-phosphogluconolactonase